MMDEMYDMDILPMTKRELAQMYSPDLTPHSAVNRLMRWVRHHPVLRAKLEGSGYRKRARLLSARQVGLIVEYLGEP